MEQGKDNINNEDYVSTGHLPSPQLVQTLVDEAYTRFKTNTDGENSQVYPALAQVSRDLFGICVAGTNGTMYEAGETDHEFSIMSVSKPFIFALICQLVGPMEARAKLGANSTGRPFNSLAAVELSADGLTESDGECGCDRDHQPCSGGDKGSKMVLHS